MEKSGRQESLKFLIKILLHSQKDGIYWLFDEQFVLNLR